MSKFPFEHETLLYRTRQKVAKRTLGISDAFFREGVLYMKQGVSRGERIKDAMLSEITFEHSKIYDAVVENCAISQVRILNTTIDGLSFVGCSGPGALPESNMLMINGGNIKNLSFIGCSNLDINIRHCEGPAVLKVSRCNNIRLHLSHMTRATNIDIRRCSDARISISLSRIDGLVIRKMSPHVKLLRVTHSRIENWRGHVGKVTYVVIEDNKIYNSDMDIDPLGSIQIADNVFTECFPSSNARSNKILGEVYRRDTNKILSEVYRRDAVNTIVSNEVEHVLHKKSVVTYDGY